MRNVLALQEMSEARVVHDGDGLSSSYLSQYFCVSAVSQAC
jgi:hypothetical protein